MAFVASGLGSGAVAMSDVPEMLPSGDLVLVELSRAGTVFSFVPATNSVYDICLFPADEREMDVRAELWQGEECLDFGENSMLPVSQRLIAGEEYAIRLYGTGSVYLELARHALSRCFSMPMQLDSEGDEYSKAIARTGDVHWYSVIPDSDLPVILAADPEGTDMGLTAALFGPDGRMVAQSVQTEKGAFILDFVPQAGQTYYIRIHDPLHETGTYNLMVQTGETADLPQSIGLNAESIVIRGRSWARIIPEIIPENACDILYWESSDESVARVSQNGRISGISSGTALITAYGPGGLSAQCEVSVECVPVEDISLLSDTLRMNVGDDASLECEILPANASDPWFEFSVWPEDVVKIDKGGVVRAVGVGTALITVTTRDGGHTATAQVIVDPAVKRYRALLVGQQSYAATVAAERPGSANSVNGIRSMLETLSYDGAIFQVNTSLDASRDEVLAAIDRTFNTATEQDLSLFYITCHGYYADGTTYLQMSDGSVLTTYELELALRTVPGEIVVMIDCCGSGGAIAGASAPDDILTGILTVFHGNVGNPAFASSKYKVIASAALEQDSYRISFDEEAAEAGMATVFARSLCEALGWSIDTSARSALRADVNYDSAVTFTEMCNYIRRRVTWYLDRAGTSSYVQTVRFWPETSTDPLFSR